MARVVSQRPSPPYLLIVFVFLFLVSTAIAGLLYLEVDKARKAKAEDGRLLGRFANERERQSPQLLKMFDEYEKSKGRDTDRETVVAQLMRTIRDLVERITGDPTVDASSAKTAADDACKVTKNNAGLAVQVVSLAQTGTEKDKQIDDLNGRVKALGVERDKKDQDLLALIAKFGEERQVLQGQITALDRKLTAQQTAHGEAMKEVEEGYQQKVTSLNEKISKHLDAIDKLKTEVAAWENKYAILLNTPPAERPKPETLLAMIRKPAGKIERVLEENGICYISIGRKDRVRPGVTFTVYPANAFGDETKKKGSLLVTSVRERVSVCRIAEPKNGEDGESSKKGEPILAGDLIENIAYDPDKTFAFLVEGQFNLSGQQEPVPEGVEEVKALIRRCGGGIVEVEEKVDTATNEIEVVLDPQTDYVVLGSEPIKPGAITEDAEPSERAVYQKQKRAYDRYVKIREKALDMKIPMLNQNRFIALTGSEAAMLEKD